MTVSPSVLFIWMRMLPSPVEFSMSLSSISSHVISALTVSLEDTPAALSSFSMNSRHSLIDAVSTGLIFILLFMNHFMSVPYPLSLCCFFLTSCAGRGQKRIRSGIRPSPISTTPSLSRVRSSGQIPAPEASQKPRQNQTRSSL